jgi:hypothetical protein
MIPVSRGVIRYLDVNQGANARIGAIPVDRALIHSVIFGRNQARAAVLALCGEPNPIGKSALI